MSIAQLSFPQIEAPHCEVCGCGEIQIDEIDEIDEVQSGGRLLLVECGRCDHRYTRRLGSSRVLRPCRPPEGAEAEVATAA